MKNMINMIKITAVLMALPLSFTGCDLNTKYQISQDTAETIFELLKEEDAEGLAELFSEEKKSKHDIVGELEQLFNSLDGNIVKYKRLDGSSESESIRDGKRVMWSSSESFTFVETDTGKTYKKLIYYMTYTDLEHPETEGINGMRLIETDDLENDLVVNVGLDRVD